MYAYSHQRKCAETADDLRQRARVDSALDWQHLNVRAGAAKLVYHTVLSRGVPGGPFPSDALLAKQALNVLRMALQGLETYWLAEMQFVAGNAISIADLLMCCELEQLVMLEAAAPEVPREAKILAPFPKVLAWKSRVERTLRPHYSDVSELLYTTSRNMAQAAKKRSRL